MIENNYIGTDSTGTVVLVNGSYALEIDSGAQATVVGAITGNVEIGGTLNLGGPSFLNVTGNYTQLSTGTLVLDIGGTTAGTLFDQLNVSGKRHARRHLECQSDRRLCTAVRLPSSP